MLHPERVLPFVNVSELSRDAAMDHLPHHVSVLCPLPPLPLAADLAVGILLLSCCQVPVRNCRAVSIRSESIIPDKIFRAG